MDAEAFRRAFVDALHQDYARLNRAPAGPEPVILSLRTIQDYIRRQSTSASGRISPAPRTSLGSTPNTGPGGPARGLTDPRICLNRDVETGQRMRELHGATVCCVMAFLMPRFCDLTRGSLYDARCHHHWRRRHRVHDRPGAEPLPAEGLRAGGRQRRASQTSKANSAIVHAGYDATPGSLMARFNVAGNARFDAWCDELDVPLVRCGSLVLAFDQADMEEVNRLYDRGVANGVPGMRILNRDEVLAMEPPLNPEVVGALYAATGGITCPMS